MDPYLLQPREGENPQVISSTALTSYHPHSHANYFHYQPGPQIWPTQPPSVYQYQNPQSLVPFNAGLWPYVPPTYANATPANSCMLAIGQPSPQVNHTRSFDLPQRIEHQSAIHQQAQDSSCFDAWYNENFGQATPEEHNQVASSDEPQMFRILEPVVQVLGNSPHDEQMRYMPPIMWSVAQQSYLSDQLALPQNPYQLQMLAQQHTIAPETISQTPYPLQMLAQQQRIIVPNYTYPTPATTPSTTPPLQQTCHSPRLAREIIEPDTNWPKIPPEHLATVVSSEGTSLCRWKNECSFVLHEDKRTKTMHHILEVHGLTDTSGFYPKSKSRVRCEWIPIGQTSPCHEEMNLESFGRHIAKHFDVRHSHTCTLCSSVFGTGYSCVRHLEKCEALAKLAAEGVDGWVLTKSMKRPEKWSVWKGRRHPRKKPY